MRFRHFRSPLFILSRQEAILAMDYGPSNLESGIIQNTDVVPLGLELTEEDSRLRP